MSSMMKLAGGKAHERNISIATYPAGDNAIIVEGTLIDDRKKKYYLATGEEKDNGTIHHMIIRLLISIPDMIIEEIETEMPAYPREECYEMVNSTKVVKGLSISQGFTLKVRSLLGGVKGCTHFMALLITMAPAALQGLWAYKSQKPADLSSGSSDIYRITRMAKVLRDTCYVWREDGPRFLKFKELIDSIVEKEK